MTGGGPDVTGRATGTDLVPAVGGTRTVPAPDPVARDYILLALRLEQHIPGLVDGYFGPADLKAAGRHGAAPLAGAPPRRRARPARPPRGRGGRSRPTCVARRPARRPRDPGRRPRRRDAAVPRLRHALLRVHAAALPGRAVRRGRGADRRSCFPGTLRSRNGSKPGTPASSSRSNGCRASWTGSSPASATAAAADFGLPDGEDLRVSLVTGQPWSAYNWFDGGRRSRVDINTDLPVRASDLIGTIAHETYPGHHLEHAWKEADLVDTQGRLESSILLINTPECLISEGLADLGVRFAVAARRVGWTCSSRSTSGPGCPSRPILRPHARPPSCPSPSTVERDAAGGASAATRRSFATRTVARTTRSWRTCATSVATRRPARRSARIHRAPAVADLRLRLRRGRGAPPPLAGGCTGTRARGSLRAAPPRAADAGRGHSSRLKTTRSSPSAS